MGTVKTTIEISDSLFAEARSLANAQGVTFRRLIEDGLRLVIERQQTGRVQFHLADGSVEGKGLQAELSWTEIRRQIYEGRGE